MELTGNIFVYYFKNFMIYVLWLHFLHLCCWTFEILRLHDLSSFAVYTAEDEDE